MQLAAAAALGYTRLSFGTSFPSDFENYERHYTIAAAFGIVIQQRFHVSVGGNMKPWLLTVDPLLATPSESKTTAADVGILIAYLFGDPTEWSGRAAIGGALINTGDDPDPQGPTFLSSLPRYNNYGASVRASGPVRPINGKDVPVVRFVFNVDVLVFDGASDEPTTRVGLEVSSFNIVFWRMGWITTSVDDDSALTTGIGLGVPTQWATFRFDYSAFPFQILGDDSAEIEDRDEKFAFHVAVPLP